MGGGAGGLAWQEAYIQEADKAKEEARPKIAGKPFAGSKAACDHAGKNRVGQRNQNRQDCNQYLHTGGHPFYVAAEVASAFFVLAQPCAYL